MSTDETILNILMYVWKGFLLTMKSICGDGFEVRYRTDQPEVVEFINLHTRHTIAFTVDEAFAYLKMILEHRSDLRHLRIGCMD